MRTIAAFCSPSGVRRGEEGIFEAVVAEAANNENRILDRVMTVAVANESGLREKFSEL